MGFFGGAVIYTAINWLLSHRGAKHRKRSDRQPSEQKISGSGLAIAIGALLLLDGIPESMVIGLSMLSGGVINAVAIVAIFLSNIPEGLSSGAGMKKAGPTPQYIFSIWAGAATTAVAAGAILAMLVDTMIPEAFEQPHDFMYQ